MTPSDAAPDARAARTAQLSAQLVLAVVGMGSALLAIFGGLVLAGAAEASVAIFGEALGGNGDVDSSEALTGLILRGLAMLGICLAAGWLVGERPRQGAFLSLAIAVVLVWWGFSGFGLLAWVPALALVGTVVWVLATAEDRPDRVPAGAEARSRTVPRILVVEHETDAPVAWFGMWLAEAGVELDVRRPFSGDTLPSDLSEHHGMVVMGGAMGANDDAEHVWLAVVKALYREAAVAGRPALGICLGHQVAAAALGGEVIVNPQGKQVGLLPVGWTAAATADPLFGTVATPRRALQWNDDVVATLPDGAELMAAAPGGEVQAARFADTIWGVQWHPEVDRDIVARWVYDEGLPDGRDAETELDALEAARAELDEAWRPLAQAFARLTRAVPIPEGRS